MREVRLHMLRPPEVLQERERVPLVYVPLGPLEWHSFHMPLGTDPLIAEAVACAAARQTGGVVVPTLYWGTERERAPDQLRHLGLRDDDYVVGMDFPGHPLSSLYAPEEVFSLVVRHLTRQLVALEYRLIVLVNGHGARNHVEVLKRLCVEWTARTPATVIQALAHPTDENSPVGHADTTETSMMMALHEGTVELSALPPMDEPLPLSTGVVDAGSFAGHPRPDRTVPNSADPRREATASRGHQLVDQVVASVTGQVEAALDDVDRDGGEVWPARRRLPCAPLRGPEGEMSQPVIGG
jgi:creatinine amidohydrolase